MKQTKSGVYWWIGITLVCDTCGAKFVLDSVDDRANLRIDEAPDYMIELWRGCPDCEIGVIHGFVPRSYVHEKIG